MSSYSPSIPTSFDPALLLSELEFPNDAPPSLSHSDELDALEQIIAEERVQKNKAGIVVQHRAWNTLEAFRSEEDHTIGTAGVRYILHRANYSRHSAQVSTVRLSQAASLRYLFRSSNTVIAAHHAAYLIAGRLSPKLGTCTKVTNKEEEIRCGAESTQRCPEQ